MAPRLTWSRLLPGIIAIVVLVAGTVAVLVYGAVGRVPGDKLRLHVVTNSARGVMSGTEVWLAGQKVGVVKAVSFQSPATDTTARVVISMDVREKDAEQIRRDSDVRVRAGANVIGPIVVYVAAGTPGSPAVQDGDTLVADTQTDVQSTMRRFGDAARELGPLMEDARAVMAQARDPDGTVGAVLAGGGRREMVALRNQVGALRNRFSGTANPRARLMNRVQHAMAQVDSIRALLRSERSSIGRFRRDSTLARTVADVRDEVAALRAQLEESDGTLGRFMTDSAIMQSLAQAQAELALLAEDVRKRPLRYLAF